MELLTGRPVSARDRIVRTLDQLPAFSPIINRILASLAREHVSFAELATMIEKDTVLAGNLLRLVNSPLYGLRGTISAVPHAISILGLTKLQNIVLTLSLSRMWRQSPAAASWSSANFNLHSAATAALCDLLVQRVNVVYAEGAFTAGLFHDIGKLIVATALPAEYDTICSQAMQQDSDAGACEAEILGATHAEFSAMALAHWNLPTPIQRAVKLHHIPEAADGWRLPLSQIVHAANRCVNAMGIVAPPVTVAADGTTPEQALEALGLDERILRVLAEFQSELEMVRSFF